jgi:hypothetical protein
MSEISFEFDLNQRVMYNAAIGPSATVIAGVQDAWRAGRIVEIILNEGGNYYNVLDVHDTTIIRVAEDQIQEFKDETETTPL